MENTAPLIEQLLDIYPSAQVVYDDEDEMYYVVTTVNNSVVGSGKYIDDARKDAINKFNCSKQNP